MPRLEVSRANAAALTLDSLVGTRKDECQQLHTSIMQHWEKQYAITGSLQPDTFTACSLCKPHHSKAL